MANPTKDLSIDWTNDFPITFLAECVGCGGQFEEREWHALIKPVGAAIWRFHENCLDQFSDIVLRFLKAREQAKVN